MGVSIENRERERDIYIYISIYLYIYIYIYIYIYTNAKPALHQPQTPSTGSPESPFKGSPPKARNHIVENRVVGYENGIWTPGSFRGSGSEPWRNIP